MALEQKWCRYCEEMVPISILAKHGRMCKPCDAAEKRRRRAAYKIQHSSGPSTALDKKCPTCKQLLSAEHFTRCASTSDGLETACRDCKRKGVKKRQLQDEGRASREHTLYVFLNPVLPGMVKIGRTSDVRARAYGLSACHPFTIQVCHEYPGFGFLEQIIHDKVRESRVTGFMTREWFNMSAEQAHAIISGTIAEWELAHP